MSLNYWIFLLSLKFDIINMFIKLIEILSLHQGIYFNILHFLYVFQVFEFIVWNHRKLIQFLGKFLVWVHVSFKELVVNLSDVQLNLSLQENERVFDILFRNSRFYDILTVLDLPKSLLFKAINHLLKMIVMFLVFVFVFCKFFLNISHLYHDIVPNSILVFFMLLPEEIKLYKFLAFLF